MIIRHINRSAIKKCCKLNKLALNIIGKRSVNSISYNIKNTHIKEKFKLKTMFTSDKLLKPHS